MSILEPEGHPPIPRYGDGEVAGQSTGQRMQSKPRQIHVLRRTAPVEHCEDAYQFADMLWSHSSRTAAIVERPQPSVLER